MTEIGRRERKKAATRQALADAALRLFLERGYDRVSIRDIADAADVSTTTLFKHFPSKEALVFDEDAEREKGLVEAVRSRPAGVSIPAAIRAYMISTHPHMDDPGTAEMLALVAETPALADYFQKLWMRHEDALAREIGGDPARARALAHLALSIRELDKGGADGMKAVDAAFAILENGWASGE
jgi:AcrR family transcriptional regulator